ncbi:tRNA (N6-adenosine(37)-N6)-threonylcarbamoyltransferase complex ATPase TsaE [Thiosulfatimonas sediminis]|uniref:tRNA threonylcarbamoyladenosine biosynthesis protein TsaE n=1 Tax=Thiosulfatimonas sediminis TaxID=2675054 RepID=A0A6F8PUL7_9GAMM|nr:tRNA (adenosine(37)-N6)-threonylcarbamoyltransferase complex ATPase subunit type 1 TsaE [Thiosulfatimonas sediminis]BBP45670.1 tRNA (N6-adenosine(37)-N6)-threonylcarbamoyltransferase complex ATPase TsaE [Thiosulfatimonas sediminis]
MENSLQFFLADESASQSLAQGLATQLEKALSENRLQSGLVIYLKGNLGAGKSYLSRAFIQHFLPDQKVKSPTYTLVESYPVDVSQRPLVIHHFDLYRLCDPEELEYLAIRDLLQGRFIALVEWPQNGYPVLPAADMVIELAYLEKGRHATVQLSSLAAQMAFQGFRFP